MDNKRLALCGLVGGLGLGIISLPSPSVRDFVDGFLGIPPKSSANGAETVNLKAELASPTLSAPLRPEQTDELFQGLLYLLHDQYTDAVPLLGKYALLGDGRAQSAIGSMYYFGMGLPLDRVEGVRWLALAAAQGTPTDKATLADAINGRLEWDRPEGAPQQGFAANIPPIPSFDPGASPSSRAYADSVLARDRAIASALQRSAPMGARTSVDQAYEDEPASGRYIPPAAPSQPLNFGSPVILNRAGPGTYSDGSGDTYAQAGPHGVVNTRTGEFSPTN